MRLSHRDIRTFFHPNVRIFFLTQGVSSVLEFLTGKPYFLCSKGFLPVKLDSSAPVDLLLTLLDTYSCSFELSISLVPRYWNRQQYISKFKGWSPTLFVLEGIILGIELTGPLFLWEQDGYKQSFGKSCLSHFVLAKNRLLKQLLLRNEFVPPLCINPWIGLLTQ